MKRGKRDQKWFLLGEVDLMSTFMAQQYNISLVHNEVKTILKLYSTLSSEKNSRLDFRSSFKVNLRNIVIFDAYFHCSNCHLFKDKLFELSNFFGNHQALATLCWQGYRTFLVTLIARIEDDTQNDTPSMTSFKKRLLDKNCKMWSYTKFVCFVFSFKIPSENCSIIWLR